MTKKLLIVTKSVEQSLDSLKLLEIPGVDVIAVPVIETIPIEWNSTLNEMRTDLYAGAYDALVFTSATTAVVLSEQFDSTQLPSDMLVFAQAEKTAAAVKSYLNYEAIVLNGTQTSEALADLVFDRIGASGKVCFLAAKKTSGGFLAQAKQLGLQVDHFGVYETKQLNFQAQALEDWHQSYEELYYLVYSPSAVQSIVKSYSSSQSRLSLCKFFSIGARTSAEVKKYKLDLVGEAPQTSDKALCSLVQDTLKCSDSLA